MLAECARRGRRMKQSVQSVQPHHDYSAICSERSQVDNVSVTLRHARLAPVPLSLLRVLSATVQNLAGPAGGWLVLAGLAGRGCSGGPGTGAGEVAGVARWRTIGKEAAWPPWQVRSDYGGTVKRGAVNRPPLPRRARDKASNDGDANETLCGPRWMSGHRSRDHGIFGREVARSRDVAGGCAGTHAFAGGGTFALNSRRAGAGEHALSGELARGGWQGHHPSLATRPGATLSREFARRFEGSVRPRTSRLAKMHLR
jgi:hypothetical protein